MESQVHRYVHTRGETYGPVDDRHLILWFREGRFSADDFVFLDEEERWVPARSLPSLAVLVPPAPKTERAARPPEDRPVRAASAPENLFSFEEARRFVRFPTQLPASCAVLRPGQLPQLEDFRPCTVLNISAGGAGIMASETFRVGTVVRLFIPRVDDDPEPFCVNGKVLRTAPGAQPLLTEHGMRFATPPHTVQLRLATFLERLISGS